MIRIFAEFHKKSAQHYEATVDIRTTNGDRAIGQGLTKAEVEQFRDAVAEILATWPKEEDDGSGAGRDW